MLAPNVSYSILKHKSTQKILLTKQTNIGKASANTHRASAQFQPNLTLKDFVVRDRDGKSPGEAKDEIFDDAEVVKERRRIDDFFTQEAVFVRGFVRLHQTPIHAHVPPESVAGADQAATHPCDQQNRCRP